MARQKSKNPVEEYLYQAWYIDTNIESLERQLERLKQQAYSPTTSSLAEPVSGGEKHSRTEESALKIIEYESELNEMRNNYTRVKLDIQRAIEEVEDIRQRTILRLRFIDQMTFWDISYKIHYGKSQTFQFYKNALKNIKIPKNFPY